MTDEKPSGAIKAYKGFNADKGFNTDLTYGGFRYEVGKEYEYKNYEEVCESRFRAYENPMAEFAIFPPGKSVFHEITLSGKTYRQDDNSRIAATHIKIGARLDIAGLCKAALKYVKSHCTNEINAEPGGAASAGDYGAATAGDCGAAAVSDYGAAVAGICGAASAGDCGVASAGYSGAATAGDFGVASAGYNGAATAGFYGVASSRGSSSTEKNGLSVARGNGVKVRGGLGALLVIAEENESNYDINQWDAAVVDGITIKPDTWYCLRAGEFVECEE